MPTSPPAAPAPFRNRIIGSGEIDPSDLLANPRNFRLHPRAQQDALEGVLERVGWVAPALVNQRTGFVVDGHARIRIALRREEATIPVNYVDLSEEEEALILATFDPISAMAGTDDALLGELVAEVRTEDARIRLLLDSLIGVEPLRGLVEEVAPPLPAEPITKLGDLILMGRHRLLCGDATKAADVQRLMGAERAGLMNIDPPYGVSYANDDRPNPGVAKDDLRDVGLQSFLEAAFRAAKDHALTPNAAWYMWHAHLTQGFFAAAAAAADVILSRQIIWVKPVLLLTRGQYHWKHEPCFFGWVKGHQPPDYGRGNGERDQTTVWEVDSVTSAEREEFQHSTPKPVGLFTQPILKHLLPSEICYDPFCGSGPQFIAAERLGMRCFGMDIDPLNCDVVVARWEQMTGRNAERPAPVETTEHANA